MVGNMTEVDSLGNILANPMKIFLFVLLSICFFCFAYLISLILHIFFRHPHIREHARYILFIHMLINDTLYLVDGLFLLLATFNAVYLPVPLCYIFVSLATVTFRITPYNLAAMALERYVAICYPLRHLTLCTQQRSTYAIAIVWAIGLLPNIVDFIYLCASVDKNFFSFSIICIRDKLTVNLVQNLLKSSFLIINLVTPGLIIAFTYIRVMYIAKNMSSRHSSAYKAGKTLILHAVQFLLCLFSLTSSLFEVNFRNNVIYLPMINFLIFMCLPRFLSPIIYGLRDQLLSKYIRKLQFIKV